MVNFADKKPERICFSIFSRGCNQSNLSTRFKYKANKNKCNHQTLSTCQKPENILKGSFLLLHRKHCKVMGDRK